MKVVTLYGYHGHKNLGDDLFLRLTLRWLGGNFGTRKAYVNAVDGVLDNRVEGVDVVSIDRLNHLVARFQWIRVFVCALRSDALIFSAGSIFKIQPFALIWILLGALRLIKGKRYPIIGLGVSLGPFADESRADWCSRFLKFFDVLLVRDERSFSWIGDAWPEGGQSGVVKNSYDLAVGWGVKFDLSEDRPYSKNLCSTPVLGVSINRDLLEASCDPSVSATLHGVISSIVEWARRSSGKVHVFAVCDDPKDGDRVLSEFLVSRLMVEMVECELVIHGSLKVDETIAKIGRCDLFFASRMHAGILAILAGVPVLQFSYAQKIRDYFERMELPPGLICLDREDLAAQLGLFLAEPQAWRTRARVILESKAKLLALDFAYAEQRILKLFSKPAD